MFCLHNERNGTFQKETGREGGSPRWGWCPHKEKTDLSFSPPPPAVKTRRGHLSTSPQVSPTRRARGQQLDVGLSLRSREKGRRRPVLQSGARFRPSSTSLSRSASLVCQELPAVPLPRRVALPVNPVPADPMPWKPHGRRRSPRNMRSFTGSQAFALREAEQAGGHAALGTPNAGTSKDTTWEDRAPRFLNGHPSRLPRSPRAHS